MIALATPGPRQLQRHRCRVLAQVIAGQVIQVARFNWQNTRDGCKYEQEDLGGGTNLHTSYTKQPITVDLTLWAMSSVIT